MPVIIPKSIEIRLTPEECASGVSAGGLVFPVDLWQIILPEIEKSSCQEILDNSNCPEIPESCEPESSLHVVGPNIVVQKDQDGRLTGGTDLSKTEYQILDTLVDAGEEGIPLEELALFVDRWKPDDEDEHQDIQVDENSAKVRFSSLNKKLEQGKIDWRIGTKQIEKNASGKKIKIFQCFLTRASP